MDNELLTEELNLKANRNVWEALEALTADVDQLKAEVLTLRERVWILEGPTARLANVDAPPA